MRQDIDYIPICFSPVAQAFHSPNIVQVAKKVLTERLHDSQLLAVAMDELLSITTFEQLDGNQAVPQVRILDAKSGAEVRRHFVSPFFVCASAKCATRLLRRL